MCYNDMNENITSFFYKPQSKLTSSDTFSAKIEKQLVIETCITLKMFLKACYNKAH